ncbi:Tetratricopeptide repeat protein 5 (TPR repeat protein 5) (Stress-responsive activator of p300) [Durusdinium trenchii]|uniref:Tetratricopeptide repeat protein 5 (TPR repeat protein 5) (Stress-responsive activator of p300) n=1 Tax=Durusdinium trenchii TaxID=1381693 RepID=A0ABP0QPC2_9DINO
MSTLRNSQGKARAFCIKGRACSFVPGQERVAEENLSKALKLDPQLLDAWNGLGEVYWNMQDIPQAQRCFEQALEMCTPNPVSLRNLSMALRAGGGHDDASQAASRRQNYAKALEKAKEAVALGPEDPLNWETLGNAYIGNFFVNAKRPDEIKRALIAYEKSDAAYAKLGKWNPSLHFNRGMAAKYVEDYDLALRSFARAQEIGAVGAAEERRKVLELIEQLVEHLEKKGARRTRSLKEPGVHFPDSYRNLKDLQSGKHLETALAVKVLSVLKRAGEVPVIAVCCDSSGEYLALSMYNTELPKFEQVVIPGRTVLAVEEAKLRQISVTAAPHQLSYSCVAVGNPAELTVISGGAPGTSSSLACATGGPTVYSTAADRTVEEAPAGEKLNGTTTGPLGQTRAECQEILIGVAREAGKGGRAAVLRALVPQLQSLVEKELGDGAGERLGRVEAMLERMGHGEVFQEEKEEGKRCAPGYIEGLEPSLAFHNPKTYPWTSELQKHCAEIQGELKEHLNVTEIWVPGSGAKQPQAKIAKVFSGEQWEERFPKTRKILQRLSGLRFFEVFFSQMPPRTKSSEHSEPQNYILTLHLGLQLEQGKCSLQVGRRKREWEEGQVVVFDTTYIHAAANDSERSGCAVLVLRFWHPGLSKEEQHALHLSHLLLAGTPDPEKSS